MFKSSYLKEKWNISRQVRGEIVNKKILLLILCLLIAVGSVGGILFIQNSNSQKVVCYRINKTMVKEGDVIQASDFYQSTVALDTYKDIATIKDVEGKIYSSDMSKDDIMRKSKAKDSVGSVTVELSSNEGIFGIKTDLYNSAGSMIEKGDYVTVMGIKRPNISTSDIVATKLAERVLVVSVKNDKSMALEQAEKEKNTNTLAMPIPAVVSVKLLESQFNLFSEYDEYKLIKR